MQRKKKGKSGVFVEKGNQIKKRIVGYDKERKELKELGEMLKNIDKNILNAIKYGIFRIIIEF